MRRRKKMKCSHCGSEIREIVVESEVLKEVKSVLKCDERFENIFERGYVLEEKERNSIITGVYCWLCGGMLRWRMIGEGRIELIGDKSVDVECTLDKCPFEKKECAIRTGDGFTVCIYGRVKK
jgi:hypothetical protein